MDAVATASQKIQDLPQKACDQTPQMLLAGCSLAKPSLAKPSLAELSLAKLSLAELSHDQLAEYD